MQKINTEINSFFLPNYIQLKQPWSRKWEITIVCLQFNCFYFVLLSFNFPHFPIFILINKHSDYRANELMEWCKREVSLRKRKRRRRRKWGETKEEKDEIRSLWERQREINNRSERERRARKKKENKDTEKENGETWR